MSLRAKITLILSAVVVLYAAFDNGILRLMAARSFESWELEDADRRLRDARWLLEDGLEELRGQARLLSELELVRGALSGDGPERRGLEASLGKVLSGDGPLDVLVLCDDRGDVVWGRILDPRTREPIGLRELPGQRLDPRHPLFVAGHDQAEAAGLMLTEREPLLVARASLAPGRMASVITGRFFDDELRSLLEGRATLDVEILDVASLELADGALRDEITSSPGMVSRAEGDRLRLWQTIPDLLRRPSIVLQGELERVIAARGRTAVDYALLSTTATTLLILLVLLRLLQGIVIRPLSTLTQAAVTIGRTDDTTMRVGLERGDEIGRLSAEFDGMLEKLARSREEVVRTARLAGMSEIATGVLHNVGNVLNSVNVSANLVCSRAERLPAEDLARLCAVLEEHADDLAAFVGSHPQGRQLLPFLAELSGELTRGKEEVRGELATLGQGIEHMADLVRSQQSYAGTKGVFEPAKLDRQVDAAVKMCAQAYGDAEEVELEREYGELPSVLVDKHKLMEILVNLLQNARQALQELDRPQKRIVLRTRAEGGLALIEVEDNGPGIEPQNLERIFHHGFTTKPRGHGFGLHVSANAATEMGGRLRACSDGPGRGARFVLELPLRAAAEEPETAGRAA